MHTSQLWTQHKPQTMLAMHQGCLCTRPKLKHSKPQTMLPAHAPRLSTHTLQLAGHCKPRPAHMVDTFPPAPASMCACTCTQHAHGKVRACMHMHTQCAHGVHTAQSGPACACSQTCGDVDVLWPGPGHYRRRDARRRCRCARGGGGLPGWCLLLALLCSHTHTCTHTCGDSALMCAAHM